MKKLNSLAKALEQKKGKVSKRQPIVNPKKVELKAMKDSMRGSKSLMGRRNARGK
jgi:hypothetical protein